MQPGFIRNILAGLMVLLFGLSITPKITLHDLVANHKDKPYRVNDSKNKQIDVSGFHCYCDNLVVESPFLDECAALHIASITVPRRTFSSAARPFYFTSRFYFALRGPPDIS
jgi:hypothetical protein